MLSDRSAARELDPVNLDILKTNTLQVWVNDERANHDVFSEFNSEIYAWMLEQLQLTTRLTPTPAEPNRSQDCRRPEIDGRSRAPIPTLACGRGSSCCIAERVTMNVRARNCHAR